MYVVQGIFTRGKSVINNKTYVEINSMQFLHLGFPFNQINYKLHMTISGKLEYSGTSAY